MKIQNALKHIKGGKPLIIVDHEDRENEGDIFIPAAKVTPDLIRLMITRGGGLVCLAITKSQANRLDLPLMVATEKNTEKTGVNFTVSVNAKKGTSTGVSAYDRAHTIKVMSDPNSTSEDINLPGHVFGLVARSGGIIERPGHTEAAVELSRLAGFEPAGVLCEVVGESGEMAKLDELEKIAKEIDAKVISIDEIIKYVKQKQPGPVDSSPDVTKVAESKLPTKFGDFKITVYRSNTDHTEHVALTKGSLKQPVITRIHSMCLTGDTFGSLRCDCQNQLHKSLEIVENAGSGIILYLNQEGRGIGLTNKIKAYALQDKGLDTLEANCRLGLPIDSRDYKIAADILKCKKINHINLLTNNPDKVDQLTSRGIKVDLKPHETEPNEINKKYLTDKKNKMGHKLTKV